METPGLNNWTSLFLIVAGTGLFVALLLAIKARKNRGNVYLGVVLSAFSIILIQYVLFWSRYIEIFPYFALLPECLLLVIAPTLYLLARNKAGAPFHSKIALLYLPAALALGMNIFYWTGIISFLEFATWNLSGPLLVMRWVMFPWTVVGFYVFIAILIWKLRKEHSAKTSPTRSINHMVKSIVFFLGAFTVAYGSYFILVKFPFFNAEWDYAISFVMSGGIYMASATLYLQPKLMESWRHHPHKDRQQVLTPQVSEEIFDKIKRLLKTENLHHDENLRLEVLSEKLELPRHYISHVINNKSGQNFNRFINDYRLQDAEELLLSHPKMSIKQIYFQVGFNNKATFYQVFKEKHACTPQEYRNRLRMQAV